MPRLIWALSFVLLFLSFALADLSVTLFPLEDSNSPFYVDEVRYYKIRALNSSLSDLDNVQIVVKSSDEFSLILKGEPRDELYYTFLVLSPNFAQERVFEIKALSETQNAGSVWAQFGQDQNFSLPLHSKKSPLEISANLSNKSLKPEEEGSFSFDISNISAELFSSQGYIVQGDAFEKASLAPSEKVSGNIFFTIGEQTGRTPIVLRVFFDDAQGTHVIEKGFEVEVGNKDLYVFLIIGAIILCVLVYFYKSRVEKEDGDAEHDSDDDLTHAGKWAH